MGILKYLTKNQSGFTKIELLVVLLILCLYASLVIPAFTSMMVFEKDAEVKSNLHVIQAAIERYYVDNQKYPQFLLGGDKVGWRQLLPELSLPPR
ncbi:MAG: prepilin-type N-terminal cleavage/methylation domain-containing protein [bacterium]